MSLRSFFSTAACVMVMNLPSSLGLGDETKEPDPVITIEAIAKTAQTLQSVILMIKITNPTQHEMRFKSTDREPPVVPVIVNGADGRRLVLGKSVKRGKSPDPANWTRDREYIFGPGEVRTYTSPITDLLPRDFHFGAANSEVVHIKVSLVILTFEGGMYHARSVDSNTIDVNVL